MLVTQSCLTLCDPCGLKPASLLCPWNSPGSYTGVGCHSLLQGIFLTQGLNLGPLHCRQILYHLSHQGHPNAKVKVAQWCPTLCDQWTIQSIEFSRPEYWSGWIPLPSPGDLSNPGIKSRSPTLPVDSLPAEPQGKP